MTGIGGAPVVRGAVPEVDLTDQAGRPWRLADALGEGAVVLVFYRGDW
jgi:peroxiredoxin